MRRANFSPSCSPVSKRQRLSSPTYDEQLGDLTQDDIDAFDQMDAQLSQSPRKDSGSQFRGRVPTLHHTHSDVIAQGSETTVHLSDDPDNPFTTALTSINPTEPTFTSASAVSLLTFGKVSYISNATGPAQQFDRSPSPAEPSSQDFATWFEPAAAIPPIIFHAASNTFPTVETSASVGFSRASMKGIIAPSSAALAMAQAKMEEIWKEPDPILTPSSGVMASISAKIDTENLLRPVPGVSDQSYPRRPALQPVGNIFDSPSIKLTSIPSPLGSFRTSAHLHDTTSSSILTETFLSKNSKPFKPPLMTKRPIMHNTDPSGSPINLARGHSSFAPPRSQHPLASLPITAPLPLLCDSPTTITPARHPRTLATGATLKRNSPAPFVTPFKPGMKPGQPGRLKLEAASKPSQPQRSLTPHKPSANWLLKERPGDKSGQATRTSVFNLIPPLNRRTLVSSGLIPQQHTAEALESMGINSTELLRMTPKLAVYYSFHTPTNTPLYPLTPNPPVVLGPAQALGTLLDNGCSLATKDWVDNHWALILWKLAGMACLDPLQESKYTHKRWCWPELMRQLFYRYERELNNGTRPPLRLVSTHDVSAALPMILCVSNIEWVGSGFSEDGAPLAQHPELEVTDGWYRLRAEIDAPLSRAIKRGLIRVGRKIGVAGATLSSEKKDPSEILEAYSSVKLVISGNSSHMAPWHAKLGFMSSPCISTLHSLTPDGGVVATMDLVVIKTHPIAYIEFIEDEGGVQTRVGPMDGSAEAVKREEWKCRWEREMLKLRTELEKKWERYEGYLDRLERRAGIEGFRSSQDEFPLDVIENIYDELEDPVAAPNVLSSLGRSECSSLARYIRDQLEKDKAHASEEIDNELKHLCPPRDIRNFRIIVVQDARTQRRPGNRRALLNVWDVLNLSFSEGASPGAFDIGQRFIVTNLKPTHHTAWMGNEPGDEVYLCTTQKTRWTCKRKMKA